MNDFAIVQISSEKLYKLFSEGIAIYKGALNRLAEE